MSAARRGSGVVGGGMLSLLMFLPTFAAIVTRRATRIPSMYTFIGPVVKAGNVKRAFPNTYTPFKLMRLDPSASAVPRGVSKACRGGTCRCYTKCRCRSPAVIKFDRARLDNAKRSSLNSVLVVPTANRLGLGPKETNAPSRKCHSHFDRSARITHPKCCRIRLTSCNVGTRLATARQMKVRGCAFPSGTSKRVVLSLVRKVCGCSKGAL